MTAEAGSSPALAKPNPPRSDSMSSVRQDCPPMHVVDVMPSASGSLNEPP